MASAAVALEQARMGELKSQSFTILKLPVSTVMKAVLQHCAEQARTNKPVGQDSINGVIGSRNMCGSTASGVLKRLEDDGYIERRIYQRGVQVHVLEIGLWTAPPPCTVPHWRTITDRAPLPAIQHVRERDQSLASWIETTARSLGRDYLDFASELLRRGAQDYRAEQQEAHL